MRAIKPLQTCFSHCPKDLALHSEPKVFVTLHARPPRTPLQLQCTCGKAVTPHILVCCLFPSVAFEWLLRCSSPGSSELLSPS